MKTIILKLLKWAGISVLVFLMWVAVIIVGLLIGA
jgi:hypothetical protein